MKREDPYQILPFNFKRRKNGNVLAVNEVGDFIFLNTSEFDRFVGHNLDKESSLFKDLKSKHFLADGDLPIAIDLIANKYRTRKGFLRHFTSLHMMVITVRCNQDCKYCQVSAEADDAFKFDMSPMVARAVVDRIFEGPSDNIKIEFQGGEPTLNWSAVTSAIEYAEELNKSYSKNLSFVVCTNLTNISLEQLSYLKEHHVHISTSLDGPEILHDSCRLLRTGEGSFAKFSSNLQMAREKCGHESVNALMTITSNNINNLKDVVDYYIANDFRGIFLRSLNPYGMAVDNQRELSYSTEEWLSAYDDCLTYIVSKNLEGHFFPEFFTSLLLSRILTPFSTGFVDLQSPAGAGIAGAIYDYQGDVFPADEARMLSRMGDDFFRLGNVQESSFREIFGGDKLKKIISESNVETLPGCAFCAYQSYCGVDPVRNYLETGDMIGDRTQSSFCEKMMGAFDLLFDRLEKGDMDELSVFWSWITMKPIRG